MVRRPVPADDTLVRVEQDDRRSVVAKPHLTGVPHWRSAEPDETVFRANGDGQSVFRCGPEDRLDIGFGNANANAMVVVSGDARLMVQAGKKQNTDSDHDGCKGK